MKYFGASAAKTHFYQILADVMTGEKYVITKHGIEVGMLIPFPQNKDELTPVENAIRALKKLRKGITLGTKGTVRKLIDDGRR
jgi:prevent-host-death family protein